MDRASTRATPELRDAQHLPGMLRRRRSAPRLHRQPLTARCRRAGEPYFFFGVRLVPRVMSTFALPVITFHKLITPCFLLSAISVSPPLVTMTSKHLRYLGCKPVSFSPFTRLR